MTTRLVVAGAAVATEKRTPAHLGLGLTLVGPPGVAVVEQGLGKTVEHVEKNREETEL